MLVVDDHVEARRSLADVLTRAGYNVDCAGNGHEALNRSETACYDVIITDLRMPGMSGLELVYELERRSYGAQIVVVTAYATVSTAVEAVRHGAFDFIEKPFDIEQLEDLVARAIEQGELRDRASFAAAAMDHAMIGSSRIMRDFRQKLQQIAPTGETVLITGESGTGKELAARAIHALSTRADRPMVSLNCPALSAHLMESELFGHDRGAFTGADSSRTGRFELADGGTILLDEVTEIDLPLQAKLLRVLQERTFERVGSGITQSIDVRVLATTNQHLSNLISQGGFREDLYYRLAVLPLHVSPLRQRKEDLPELLEHFRDRAARRLAIDPCEFSRSAMDLICHYDWPGNVRELENIVTRASVLSGGRTVQADDMRPWLIHREKEQWADTSDGIQVGLSLHDMERKLIEATLDHFAGHREKTAQALGIGIRTLSGKLRAYGYAPRARRPAA